MPRDKHGLVVSVGDSVFLVGSPDPSTVTEIDEFGWLTAVGPDGQGRFLPACFVVKASAETELTLNELFDDCGESGA